MSTPIPELSSINKTVFEQEIQPNREPVVLRSLVSHWPLVELCDNQTGFVQALASADSGVGCYTIVAPPEAKGRMFYGDNLQGTNFNKTKAPITDALKHIINQKGVAEPHAIAVQAAKLKDAMPALAETHQMPLLDKGEPTFWLSSPSLVAPHFDLSDNLACVVHGTREFTLFPPEQIANLYVGPTIGAPGGVPISTVDLEQPDFERFPRFKEALASAQTVTLNPGDALYIPSPWWHAVRSAASVNLLVNFWWQSTDETRLGANQSLIHAMLSIAKLPRKQRDAWRAFFDYLVFQPEFNPTEHWPDGVPDVATSLTNEQLGQVLAYLASTLKKN